MPSAGLPIRDLTSYGDPSDDEVNRRRVFLNDCAQVAMRYRLFVEWLESFTGAWEATHDVYEAARAGLIEWDMA